jgi:hypothetical protein
MMIHACNTSYVGVQGKPQTKNHALIQKITKAKKSWEHGSSGRTPAYQTPVKLHSQPQKAKIFKIKNITFGK